MLYIYLLQIWLDHTYSCFIDLVEVEQKLQKFLKKNSEAILFYNQKPKAT